MPRNLLPFIAALVACTPSPREAAMPSPNPAFGTTVRNSTGSGDKPVAPDLSGRGVGTPAQAGPGSIPEPVTVAENAAPGRRADSAAEAQGRRALSTAFVRVGPGGHLTVELSDGRAIVLRDVVMRPGDYCGVQVLGGSAGTRYCGGYADVLAARPGGAPAPEQPDPVALDPAEAGRKPSGHE